MISGAAENKVSTKPESVCGFNPCKRKTCPKHRGSAVCVSDKRCKAVFLDSRRMWIKYCENSE